jgi:hypothetical protein
MAELEALKEQRKHKRYFPKEWVSAFCQTHFVGIGKLVDISMGGAAFQYVQRFDINLTVSKKPLKLDLFETVTSHGVKQIECKVVYDIEVPRQSNSSGGYRLRRCAVEFGEYNWQQFRQLNMFIKDFTLEQN